MSQSATTRWRPAKIGIVRRFARERTQRLIPEESDSFAPLLRAQLGAVEPELLVVGLVVAVAAPGVEHVGAAAGFGVEERGGGGEALGALLDDGLTVIDDVVHRTGPQPLSPRRSPIMRPAVALAELTTPGTPAPGWVPAPAK